MPWSRSRRFLASGGAALRRLRPSAELERILAGLLERAHTAWPEFDVTPDGFLGHVGARLPADRDPATALERLHVEDLYLAYACSTGERRALAEFESRFLTDVGAYVARTDPAPLVADEVRQVLRVRLLVAKPPAAPAIATYTGRGALGGWLRIAAIRVARDLRSAGRWHLPLDEHQGIASACRVDPELDYMKTRYAAEFRAALADVLSRLEARDANILRLYFFDGVRSDAIGALYHVDGSTVRRWLTRLRQLIFDQVRLLLVARLQIPSAEFESLMLLVRSRIEVSIAAHLRDSRTRTT